MGRVIGLLVVVLGIWGAAELMWYGPDQAFGGALVRLGWADSLRKSDGTPIGNASDPESRGQNTGMKAANKYRGAFDAGINRAEKALGEEPVDDWHVTSRTSGQTD